MKTAAALLVVAVSATTAAAEPTLDRVDKALGKGAALTVTVEATLTTAGDVSVTGELNGRPVALHKRMKAGHKTLKFVVDPKKLRLNKLTEALRFDLVVTAHENVGEAETSQPESQIVLPPCIVLPGLGNEQTGGLASVTVLANGLDAVASYDFSGPRPRLFVHSYDSLTKSLATLGSELDRAVKKTLKGSPFAQVDLVGYSYGGLVVRSYLSQFGGARVRDCVFMGTPNEGTPIAYVGVGLLNNGQLPTLLGANPQLSAAVGGLVNDGTKESLKNLFPTYKWVTPDNFITTAIVTAALGDPTTPLTALNAKGPPLDVTFHEFHYVSTGTLGTVDVVDVSALSSLSGGASGFDPATIATGSGDGVVPAHSVTMDEVASWAGLFAKGAPGRHELAVGTHVTMPADPLVIAGVAAVLTAQ